MVKSIYDISILHLNISSLASNMSHHFGLHTLFDSIHAHDMVKVAMGEKDVFQLEAVSIQIFQ